MFGILNIYKPVGLTSHDVVGILRKILKIKQVGHAGTLDPFAQGVLPVCVGKATRLIEYLDDDKEYLATVKFGSATETYDVEGKVTKTSDKNVSAEEVVEGLKSFEGKISQVPPIYSAIKVNGKKLYEYARNNEEVKIEPRTVFIEKIELKEFDKTAQVAQISIKCSKGTYIRSIANNLGENLGCFAHLIRLERTVVGKFLAKNSIELPVKLTEPPQSGKAPKFEILEGAEEFLTKNILNPADILSTQKILINEKGLERISNGNPLKISAQIICEKKLNAEDFVILVYNNEVKAVGQVDGLEIKIRKVFV